MKTDQVVVGQPRECPLRMSVGPALLVEAHFRVGVVEHPALGLPVSTAVLPTLRLRTIVKVIACRNTDHSFKSKLSDQVDLQEGPKHGNQQTAHPD